MKKNFGEMPYHKAVKVFQKVRGELSTLAVDLFEDWVRSAGYIVAEAIMNQENSVEYKVNKMADPKLNIVEFWGLFPGKKEWKDFCEMYRFAKYDLLYNSKEGKPSKIVEAMCVLLKNLPDANFEVTECCPHCGAESTYKAWKVVTDGYAEYCQNCKKQIMICSLCTDVRCDAECGWHQKKGKTICWRTTH